MKTQKVNIHSQQYMETMARLMSEALESPEGLRALAAAIAAPIEQEIKRKEISSLLLTKHTLPKGERPVYQKKPLKKLLKKPLQTPHKTTALKKKLCPLTTLLLFA